MDQIIALIQFWIVTPLVVTALTMLYKLDKKRKDNANV